MEQSVFPLPEVSAELQQFVEARLNMDLPHMPFAAQNEALQRRFAGTKALPVYVAIDPHTEEPLARMAGALGAEQLLAFLRQARGAKAKAE
jgi:hypothetical protein